MNEELQRFPINELYRQLIWTLHIAVNCDDGTDEIVQQIGKVVEICREQKEKVELH